MPHTVSLPVNPNTASPLRISSPIARINRTKPHRHRSSASSSYYITWFYTLRTCVECTCAPSAWLNALGGLVPRNNCTVNMRLCAPRSEPVFSNLGHDSLIAAFVGNADACDDARCVYAWRPVCDSRCAWRCAPMHPGARVAREHTRTHEHTHTETATCHNACRVCVA